MDYENDEEYIKLMRILKAISQAEQRAYAGLPESTDGTATAKEWLDKRADTGEWAHLALLCATVVDLTEQGFTIDGETLARIRWAISIPRWVGDAREIPSLIGVYGRKWP